VASGRRSARRQAAFTLYQQDLLGLTPAEALLRVAEGNQPDPYTRRLVVGVGEHREEIDQLLNQHLSEWTVDRLGILERSILRIGAYELEWEDEVPNAVAIDEAVVLAKRFCSDEAGALVNGVLGSIVGNR
jgi:N utilization substance protein B